MIIFVCVLTIIMVVHCGLMIFFVYDLMIIDLVSIFVLVIVLDGCS